jgi:Domain of unknown function (DUF1906)
MLNGSIQLVPNGALLFDTDTPVAAETAAAFVTKSYQGCLRYLSLETPQQPGDLTTEEAEGILAAGLALMAVQHVLDDGWLPTQELGRKHGRAAGLNAEQVDFPPGVCLWLDLEGVNASATDEEIVEYCEAWYDAVSSYFYMPGLYVGPNCLLTGEQLWSLPFQHYWRSAAVVPDVAHRGYQMTQQLVTALVAGIAVDDDTANADNLGGQAIWLAPAQS